MKNPWNSTSGRQLVAEKSSNPSRLIEELAGLFYSRDLYYDHYAKKIAFSRAQRQVSIECKSWRLESLKVENFRGYQAVPPGNRWLSCVCLLVTVVVTLLLSSWLRSKKWRPHLLLIITLGRVDLLVRDVVLLKMAPSRVRKKRRPKKKSHLPLRAEIAIRVCEGA